MSDYRLKWQSCPHRERHDPIETCPTPTTWRIESYTAPRSLCPACGRNIALDFEGHFYAHNRNASGDGALFKGKRAGAGKSPMCPGSYNKE
jgi:hypothetical protein